MFHAARQDVEIFLLRFGAVPTPLFDTQIAAMVAGFGDQVSYDSLCRSLAGVSIEKAHRFSDWSARPLSASQIAYAAADVTHLRRVYTALLERLGRGGRLDWVAEEMAALGEPGTYRVDPETAWERLRPRTQNRRALGVLRAAAAWREREAQRVNIPRQRLVRDETLLELAATAPTTPAELARARGVSEGFARGRSGGGLLAAIETAKALPDSLLPQPPQDRRNGPSPRPRWWRCSRCCLPPRARSTTWRRACSPMARSWTAWPRRTRRRCRRCMAGGARCSARRRWP